MLRFDYPADSVLSHFFRDFRELGARDRAFVAEAVYGVLRRKRTLERLCGERSSTRHLVLAWLARVEGTTLRQLGAARYGGASVGECFALAQRIQNGQPASWVNEFAAAAVRQEEDAQARARRGHALSARDQYLVACNNYRAAEYYCGVLDPRHAALGLKSRECYEVPGALTLITAHKALEDICVEGDLLKTKIKLEQDWATAVYNGQWYSPLKNALDAFMADTQKFVTGTVRLKFFKGNCHVVGRKSPFSLYDYGLATYDRDTTFDEKASAGFIEIDTLSLKTWAKVQGPSSAAAQA